MRILNFTVGLVVAFLTITNIESFKHSSTHKSVKTVLSAFETRSWGGSGNGVQRSSSSGGGGGSSWGSPSGGRGRKMF
jgi:hypothetical protein